MTSDIDGVKQLITNNLTFILSDFVTVIISLIAMFRKNWILATIGIIIVPLFTVPTRRAGKTRWKVTNESQACNDEINGILNETLSVSSQLLSEMFCREKYEYDLYRTANQRMVQLNIKESMAGRWFRVVLSTFTGIGPMLIYLVSGILIIRHGAKLTIGDITVLVALLSKMYLCESLHQRGQVREGALMHRNASDIRKYRAIQQRGISFMFEVFICFMPALPACAATTAAPAPPRPPPSTAAGYCCLRWAPCPERSG